MAAPASPELVPSINSLLKACVRGLGTILNPQLYNNRDYVNSSVDLQEEIGRLRLWAGNLGAHRKHRDRLSLDHRLREAPELHRLVSEHLSDILDAIRNANEIIHDVHNPEAHENQSPPESDDSDSDGTWSVIKADAAHFPPLQDHLFDIHHAITSLYKFSAALVNPARRDVLVKASRINRDYYVQYDIQHVSEKFGLPNDSPLVRRLAKANTRRRQLLAYYKEHGDKISKYIDIFMDEALRLPSEPHARGVEISPNQPTSTPNVAVDDHAHSTVSTEWTQDTTVSTIRMIDTDVASDAGRTVFSATSSTADHESPQTLIPLPPIPEGARENIPFPCSICCQTITLKNLYDDWEYHVYSDMRPYICTFGNCVQADQLYDSFTEWAEHERQFHRREWLCGFCSAIYSSRDEFLGHVQMAHLDIALESQLQPVVNMSERATSAAQQCPLCTRPPIPSTKRFQKHLARHLQQLSLFVVPHDSLESGIPSLQRLRHELKANLLPSSDTPLVFIPRSILLRLVNDNVVNILSEEKMVDKESINSFAQLISRKAAKLFAILVMVKKAQCIIPFLREGTQDEDLPFVRPRGLWGPGSALRNKQGESMQTVKDWDSQSIRSFEAKQHRMLSPIFRRGEHYELDDLHILPFVAHGSESDYRPAAVGGYGEVSREYIHPDHHEFGSESGRDGLVVAVKRMFYETDFEPERKIYRDLGPSSHPHLIDLLFTYHRDNKYYLVFPWANEDLRGYWEKNPRPPFSPPLLIWSLEQMVGIASGLTFFHEFTDSSTGQTRFGRHGDIKAQNILWFQPPSGGVGVLKLADLGLGNVRGKQSRSNVQSSTVVGSPTYSPPDAQRRQQVSRKWDIWGLGCLYLEFVTYLILGCEAIAEFSDQRLDVSSEFPELSTDSFYSDDYEVKPSVAMWATRLKQNPRRSTAMHDILELVMTKMIVIEPEKRSSALEVCRRLGKILDRAREDEDYLINPGLPAEGPLDPGSDKSPLFDTDAASRATNLAKPRAKSSPRRHSWGGIEESMR